MSLLLDFYVWRWCVCVKACAGVPRICVDVSLNAMRLITGLRIHESEARRACWIVSSWVLAKVRISRSMGQVSM